MTKRLSKHQVGVAKTDTAVVTAEAQPPVANIEMVKAADFLDYYSNHVKVGFSPFDLAATFGRSTETEPGKPAIEDRLTVRFSPQHFKLVCNTFASVLENWESIFGQIPDAPGRGPNTKGIEAAFAQMAKILISDANPDSTASTPPSERSPPASQG